MHRQAHSPSRTDHGTQAALGRNRHRLVVRIIGLLALLAIPFGGATALAASAGAAVSTFTYTQDMHPLGYSEREVPLDNTVPGQSIINSDLAFWGRLAFQGTYEGFRIIDITSPSNPFEIIDYAGCSGGPPSATRVTCWCGSTC